MSVQSTIEHKLSENLHPVHLEVVNESYMHSVPEGSESHFKVTAVSDEFVEKNLVARHRLINEILHEELNGPLHALSLHTLTPDEWFDRAGEISDSPECLGGSKADH
ncbi:MAG: BolA/IbaG family iron-sulfur metabolism protein [Gammaproteobacteria bacterium]|nr:BolA/IbaG family iron-sulfur metabolism protein [Gammaproteobacteria bacterium]